MSDYLLQYHINTKKEMLQHLKLIHEYLINRANTKGLLTEVATYPGIAEELMSGRR